MIGKITGRIDYVAEDHALIEAGGVGYIVHCAAPTLAALGGPGATAALYTDFVVREDGMQLFGFATPAEREWHRLLTSVQGVGPKVALAILGALGAAGIARALAAGDAAAFRTAPGVGPKLGQRIALELREKAPAFGGPALRPAPAAAGAPEAGAAGDALLALIGLGYDRSEAARALQPLLAADAAIGTPALVKAALKALARPV